MCGRYECHRATIYQRLKCNINLILTSINARLREQLREEQCNLISLEVMRVPEMSASVDKNVTQYFYESERKKNCAKKIFNDDAKILASKIFKGQYKNVSVLG